MQTYLACYRLVRNFLFTTLSFSSDLGSFYKADRDLLSCNALDTSIFKPNFVKNEFSCCLFPSLISLCTLTKVLSLHLSATNYATSRLESSINSSTSCFDCIFGDSFQLIGYEVSWFKVKLNSLFTNSIEPASNRFFLLAYAILFIIIISWARSMNLWFPLGLNYSVSKSSWLSLPSIMFYARS